MVSRKKKDFSTAAIIFSNYNFGTTHDLYGSVSVDDI
jgi:hypothetical protein